jgi:hypothetical protein
LAATPMRSASQGRFATVGLPVYTGAMNALRALAIATCCLLPLSALAQWQWIDKGGRRVFSDQAPPADVPAKNILKGPKGKPMPTSVEEAGPATAASTAAAASSAPKVSGRDKDLEARKKQADAAEAEKKKAAEREVEQAKAENCKRAKESKSNYDSGVRLSRMNEKGEREILDDSQRATESRRLGEIIARDCTA